MESNIIKIDTAKLDNEILDFERQIKFLNQELDTRLNLKKYIDSLAVIDNKKTETPKQYGGVSDFIISLLDSGDFDTKHIMEAYATEINSTYEKVSGNISNALHRLKTANKIGNKPKEGGRKAGSIWFKIKQNKDE